MLSDNIVASAAVLGDPRNESAEAMAERHERVVSSSLLALGGIVRLTLEESARAQDGSKGQARVYECVAEVLKQQGFWNRALKSSQPAVRRSAYVLVADIIAVRCVCFHGTACNGDAVSLYCV